MRVKRLHLSPIVALILTLIAGLAAGAEPPAPNTPLGTAFTYQGRLTGAAGLPVDGACDLRFSLWDDPEAGSQAGPTLDIPGVAVAGGLFTVPLDFGPVFDGAALWLEIAVRCGDDPDYTLLSPRQALTAAPYAINADLLDGKHAAAFLQRPANLVIVAKSGGDFDTITAALDSIADAGEANRYLVKVMPGVYTERVTMKPYVDIEGAGELATKITYTGSYLPDTGTLVGADNAEVRFLTVENTGGDDMAIAIYNGPGSPRLTNVTAVGLGTHSGLGVYSHYSTPIMTNVTASAVGVYESYAVFNDNSSAVMTHVIATASGGTSGSGGVVNTYASPTMTDVTATGSAPSYSYGVINLYATLTMVNVTAAGSGVGHNTGVSNWTSAVTMTNVTATASGGNDNRGIENIESSPTMTNVTATASGGTNSYGVYNGQSSSPVIRNSAIWAGGGTGNYGIYNDAYDPITVTVDSSQITGSTATFYCRPGDACRAGASLLDGGPVSGNVVCAGVYDEAYTFYASTCP